MRQQQTLSVLAITKMLIIIILSLVIGFLAGMEYKVYQIRSVLKETVKEISEVFTDETHEIQQTQQQTIIERNIGDEIELATIKFKVNSVEERQILSPKYGRSAVANEDAKFVVINMDITNITNAGFTFFPGFWLIDNQDRTFTTYEDTIWSVDNYLNVRELAPSIKENGVLVYEIPKDATSYNLAVSKAGTNEIYSILLK